MQPDRIIRSRRKTIAIEIRPDGQVWVRSPMRTPRIFIDQVLNEKAAWIQSRLNQIRRATADRPQYTYTEGELHPFLSQQRPLCFAATGSDDEAIYLPSASRGSAREALAAWYRAEATKVIPGMLRRLSEHTQLRPARVRISSARTRWGSCSSKGTISLAWRLILAPPEIIEYVIIHELVHLKVPNHSSKFWDAVQAYLPDYKTRRAWLRKNAQILEV